MQRSKLLIAVMGVLVLVAGFLAFGIAEETATTDQPVTAASDRHAGSLDYATALTKNFRDANPSEQVLGGFFTREAIEQILNQEGVAGIRYYYGTDDEGSPLIVLVGVNSDGNDLVYGELATNPDLCPPWCADWNELNSDFVSEQLATE